MGSDGIQIDSFEILGKVLEGKAAVSDRKAVLLNLHKTGFKECFMVALRATVLFSEK